MSPPTRLASLRAVKATELLRKNISHASNIMYYTPLRGFCQVRLTLQWGLWAAVSPRLQPPREKMPATEGGASSFRVCVRGVARREASVRLSCLLPLWCHRRPRSRAHHGEVWSMQPQSRCSRFPERISFSFCIRGSKQSPLLSLCPYYCHRKYEITVFSVKICNCKQKLNIDGFTLTDRFLQYIIIL